VKQFRKEIPILASPNFQHGRGGHQIDGIVLHYTAGLHSLGWMQSPLSKVSAHFLIARDGTTTQMVALDDTAWHAGRSVMTYQKSTSLNPNAFTVGIELENLGLVHKQPDGTFMAELGNGLIPYPKNLATPLKGDLHFKADGHSLSGYWEPYYEPQIKKLLWLLVELEDDYPGIINNLCGHNEIAQPVGRKIDCGPLLPWAEIGRDMNTLKVVSTTYPSSPLVT
jgi:N-acetylmuramoyl-L-alanine amidase